MNTATSAVYRLSPLQEAAFRIQRAKGKLCSQIALEIDKRVTGQELQQAIGVIAERHETLRTRFINKEGFQLPFQSVSNSPDFTWSTTSVTQSSLADLLVAEHKLCEDRLRAALATNANRNSVLVLTAPGALADASSMLVIARQLLGELAGREFTEDILQYPDVAEWQHGLLEADDELANEARSFWAQQSGQPTSLPFRQSETGSMSEASVELSAKAVSPEDAVDAAITSMFVLTHRLAGEAKPRIVELFSGRTVAELANAVGLFARTLYGRLTPVRGSYVRLMFNMSSFSFPPWLYR